MKEDAKIGGYFINNYNGMYLILIIFGFGVISAYVIVSLYIHFKKSS